ncbi:hypothetical protein H4R24_002470 [Coemansia sp. RSA 988]|nr:hypothetical protein H4R24_002470 [Coemansia sp. RSA 988]
MSKLTAQEKEKAKQVQEIEAQLRASANSATHVVDSWLTDDTDQEDNNQPTPKARELFQGRPSRLGVGAKYLSHKEMQSNNRRVIGDDMLTTAELTLKRKLTKHKSSNIISENKLVNDEECDTESRSKILAATKPNQQIVGKPSKKKKKSDALLDSLIQRRKR